MRLHNFSILGVLSNVRGCFGLGAAICDRLSGNAYFSLGYGSSVNMHRIASGGKPLWNIITLTAIATFAVTAYLLAFSFWSR
jgi:hypothetical protein